MEAHTARAARPIAIARHPISSVVLPIPVVCFVGALLTDIAYVKSGGDLLWVNFSSWLIAVGLLSGVLAGVVLLVDNFRGATVHGGRPFLALVAAWVAELVSSFVHTRDGWTAVMPLGLTLSILGAILILAAGWLARHSAEAVR